MKPEDYPSRSGVLKERDYLIFDTRRGSWGRFWRAMRGGILMSATEEIYEAMRNSGMVDWVGGGDPATIGGYNFTSITENLPLRRDHVVFDFGCGIGRTSVKLAEFLTEGGQLVGSDIVPGQIQFCREQFAHHFPNATFHCIKSSNPLITMQSRRHKTQLQPSTKGHSFHNTKTYLILLSPSLCLRILTRRWRHIISDRFGM
jgi:SAM-dependent methyltransferase